jgi:hypothetical protein
MKASRDGLHHLGIKTDFQRGVSFILASAAVFGVLLFAKRPYWAGPWLIASMFTFAVWSLSRQPPK